MLGLTASSSYLLWHLLGTDVIRDFYSVDKEDKTPEKLKQLIDQVTLDCKDVVIHYELNVNNNSNPIKWFTSAMPLYGGFAKSSSGCIVGIPPYIKYESQLDIPADQLNLTPLPLFKVKPDNEQEDVNLDDVIDEKLPSSDNRLKSHKIDINTEDGRIYINSLLLSDNARRFLIARQIFYTDTHQIVYNNGNLALAFMLPVSISRLIINQFEHIRRSVPYRLNLYMLTGTFSFLLFLMTKDMIQVYYDRESDSRAASLGINYLEGGVEYYTKCLQRNVAIRNVHKAFADTIDERGNINGGLLFRGLRQTELPLTDRLELLLKMHENEQ